MRKMKAVALIFGLLLAFSGQAATAGPGGFFHDDDGDGIPNCLDPDWYAPEDGSGYKVQNGPKVVAIDGSPLLDPGGHGGQGDCDQDKLRLRDGSCLDK